MASVHIVSCCDCNHCFRLTIGGNMRNITKICEVCNKKIYIPRLAPKAEGDGTQHLDLNDLDKMKNYLNNPNLWPISGRYFSDKEHSLISYLYSKCGCGGQFVFEPAVVPVLRAKRHDLYHCPKCFSNRLLFGESILLID